MKAAKEWRSEHGRVLQELLEEKVIRKGFGVYLGREALKQGKLEVLPLEQFMRRLGAGKILSSGNPSAVLSAVASQRRRGRLRRSRGSPE